jgi:hypothetical protein
LENFGDITYYFFQNAGKKYTNRLILRDDSHALILAQIIEATEDVGMDWLSNYQGYSFIFRIYTKP